MAASLSLADETFDLQESKLVIAGYCFHEIDSDPRPPTSGPYGADVVAWKRRRWGYLSYDCMRGSGPPPDIVDLMGPVLLNVTQGYGVRLISDLLVVAPKIREAVQEVRADFAFWDLDLGYVAPTGDPAKSEESQALHRAWYLLECVDGVDVAITHKVLHHAWPRLFPLIDNKTAALLGDSRWLTILRDLRRDAEQWEGLEGWFRDLVTRRSGVSLTRLRLYDILLWCRAVGEEEAAMEAGKDILRST